jgi:hypothetical protein
MWEQVDFTGKQFLGAHTLNGILIIGRGGGHVARIRGEVRTGFWWGNLWERDNLEDLSVDGTIILK